MSSGSWSWISSHGTPLTEKFRSGKIPNNMVFFLLCLTNSIILEAFTGIFERISMALSTP